MKIGSDPVYADDLVYSDSFGTGRVTSTYPNGCFVQFGSGVPVHYAIGGNRNGRQELYWAKPLVIIPAKNDRPETLQQAQAMAQQILELARNG